MRSVPARAALLGALFAALVTLPGLGIGTLWDNSETAYGEVAREIVLTHDWVVMHLNGQPWFVQPPLYFWLAALLAKVVRRQRARAAHALGARDDRDGRRGRLRDRAHRRASAPG